MLAMLEIDMSTKYGIFASLYFGFSAGRIISISMCRYFIVCISFSSENEYFLVIL